MDHGLPILITWTNFTHSTNRMRIVQSSFRYNPMKEVSVLTKTQIKVIITVVIIISFIMFIIAIFRFRSACRHHQPHLSVRTKIVRRESETSSRRGSVGYYTRRYSRAIHLHFDEEQLAGQHCHIDQSRKSPAVLISTSLVEENGHVEKSLLTTKGDDRTPLLKSELVPSRKNSSNSIQTQLESTRKYSLNAFLPRSHRSTEDADGKSTTDLKSRRRVSLSSALRRSSFGKHCQTPNDRIDSRRSSSPSVSSSSSSSVYRKEFMHKIERFRFIDDSASSTTTTVTSPVDGEIERVRSSNHSRQLISNAIEQFEDYLRTTYPPSSSDEMNSLIDRLDSDLLIDGSYSDLNILNRQVPTKLDEHQRFSSIQSSPMTTIPHSRTTPLQIDVNSNYSSHSHSHSHSHGYSRSMDFVRSNTLIPTINETSSSSSTATLTSLRSSTSLEFDDHSKPSGVLVDDDFLPMSSPVDDYFWDFNEKHSRRENCFFPNVGSSPDLEVKRFDLQLIQNLSETSCDEDDEETHPSITTNLTSMPSLVANRQTNDDDDEDQSSLNDLSEGEESADNGEIDLVQEFEYSQTERTSPSSPPSSSATPPALPTSIMKIPTNKSLDNLQDQSTNNALKPKVRFNLDPAYEREREWNKVNKLLGNSVEWTDEFEV